jgi:hypothetical protein
VDNVFIFIGFFYVTIVFEVVCTIFNFNFDLLFACLDFIFCQEVHYYSKVFLVTFTLTIIVIKIIFLFLLSLFHFRYILSLIFLNNKIRRSIILSGLLKTLNILLIIVNNSLRFIYLNIDICDSCFVG